MCKLETKVGEILCLLVVSEGDTLKRCLNDEVDDNEHNPTLDEIARHDVLILRGKLVSEIVPLRQMWRTPFITRRRKCDNDIAVKF